MSAIMIIVSVDVEATVVGRAIIVIVPVWIIIISITNYPDTARQGEEQQDQYSSY